MSELAALVGSLGDSKGVRDKIAIQGAYARALPTVDAQVAIGDDCAALPEQDGSYLLFAAEGLLADFVADDPWFAGYSAVMVNVSDVCAMGGRPLSVVDVLWAPDRACTAPIWEGMRAASEAYGVPIVGGHTTVGSGDRTVHLAAAIIGRAKTLLTSFDARPGDELLMAVDLNGSYHGGKPFWDASVPAAPERLRTLIALLPEIAERGWCRAAKDISNGGIVGTLIMLLECSAVGATLDLDQLPKPDGVDRLRWLLSFPSFGYLLSVAPSQTQRVVECFCARDVACKVVGSMDAERRLVLRMDGAEQIFWRAKSWTEVDA